MCFCSFRKSIQSLYRSDAATIQPMLHSAVDVVSIRPGRCWSATTLAVGMWPLSSNRCPDSITVLIVRPISVVIVFLALQSLFGCPSLSSFRPSFGSRCPAPSPSGRRHCRPVCVCVCISIFVSGVRCHCHLSVCPHPTLSVCVSDSVWSVCLIRSVLICLAVLIGCFWSFV